MPSQVQNHRWRTTEDLEIKLEALYLRPLPIVHRIELRRLADGLCHSSNRTYEPTVKTTEIDETINALQKFNANIKRRTVARDGLTSERLMELPDNARAVLLSSIAWIFRCKIDDWNQIDFGNAAHVVMLEASVTSSLAKLNNPRGRPINEALDVFFIGLRDLYEKVTGQPAVAGAHYNDTPRTDFEELMFLGYQLIRPAQKYPSALKAYERAISRN